MARYHNALPQLKGDVYLTDGGIETTLIFQEGRHLPHFAAFDLLKHPAREQALLKYFGTYATLAKRLKTGIVLESATWRANADWGAQLGYPSSTLAEANRRAIHMLKNLQAQFEDGTLKAVISGCIGPRGDGYNPNQLMSERDAEAYHRAQIETFADSGADMVTAITMNYVEEALGIASAAQQAGMPVAISFTVETDGKLATGQTLQAAIKQVDDDTSSYPVYHMINCAHPTHFESALTEGVLWVKRIRGLLVNASMKSHAELNESPDLDIGNPTELGMQHVRLKERLPELTLLGGCCGTGHRHVEQIATACLPMFQRTS